MTRHTFGGGIADFVVAPGDAASAGDIDGFLTLLVPGADITFWDALEAGTQYENLLDTLGTPASSIIADSYGAIPGFSGPDDTTVMAMYADANGGDGPRRLIIATDLPAALAAAIAQAADNATAIAELSPVAVSGEYSDLTGAPDLADVATTGDFADLDNAPAPGLQYVAKIGGSWPLRSSTAPDTSRPAQWIGPPPAPPATAGYSIAGDIWVASVS